MKMKTKKISVFAILLFLLIFCRPSPLLSAEGEEGKQKITTPPLQLTEQEEKRKTGEEKTEAIPFQPIAVKTTTNIEVILDASGSMKGLMEGTTKMDILKSAIIDAFKYPLPEGTERNIGLRVYGSTKPSETADCKDTQLLIPIGPFEKEEFTKKVAGITAMGVTPIGFSLEEALGDFKVDPNVDNIIILVTDGEDSCKANVCEIAKKLHDDPKKIIIHVIGFDLDKNASAQLECIAKFGDGQFIQARGENELRAALEQVLVANIPYNLRLKIVSGATPLPAALKVMRAGTKVVVREDETSGIKFYQLPQGTYDIEVIYNASLETPKPSKLLKNVEVQAASKAEQIVQFDLGMLTVSATDQKGAPVGAKYTLKKKETPDVTARFETPPGPYTIWLTDGTYSVSVEAVTPDGLTLTASADAIHVKKGELITQDFQFQMGVIKLVGKDKKGGTIPIAFRATPARDKGKILLEGKVPAEGGEIELPPGKYDIYVSIAVEGMKGLPEEVIEGIDIKGGEVFDKPIELATSTLNLLGKDAAGKNVETLFKIKPSVSNEKPVEFTSIDKPVTLILPPTRYDIDAVYVKSQLTPQPTITWDDFALPPEQVIDKTAVFKFGKLVLAGQNSKGAPMNTAFYIYKPGAEAPFMILNNIASTTDVELTEGYYDVMAEDLTSRKDPKPNVWFHNIEISGTKPASRVAIFTYGKLKITCKGPNNAVLNCEYKVFSYGMDNPIFEGKTGAGWIEYDIAPGNYYIEAGYHDVVDEVLLKKWITLQVNDNAIVEQVIRF